MTTLHAILGPPYAWWAAIIIGMVIANRVLPPEAGD